MSRYGKIKETGSISFERLLPGKPQEIWQYLTKSEKRGEWLASGEMELKKGGKAKLHFRHDQLVEVDEPVPEKFREFEKGQTMETEIIEIKVPELLSFTWEGGSRVTFNLKRKEDNVLLLLEHDGIAGSIDNFVSIAAGWHTHLEILEDKLFGEIPPGFWSLYSKYEAEYQERLQ
ncbi:MAG: SRPBCC family protein [Salegentibacter sp.]